MLEHSSQNNKKTSCSRPACPKLRITHIVAFVSLICLLAMQLKNAPHYMYSTEKQKVESSLSSWSLRKPSTSRLNEVVAEAMKFDWKAAIESGPIDSVPGTTGEGVPGKIREWLLTTGVPIDDNAEDHFGSEEAVKAMEKQICGGWDDAKIGFRKPECINYLKFGPYESIKNEDILPDPTEIDIVIPSIRNLDFLNDWREFFQGFHVIIIQDGDQSIELDVPEWVDFELHKRVDIERALGEGEWVISKRDASIRNYGFLLSKKRYIYTIDDDCRPAYDSKGRKINPLAFHYRNLKTPSTPYMFNTLYDPYQDGSDFVRGYPYSLRAGVPTGVSHGIWMNQPDYDAPTQLMKVNERVSQMHEMVVTVPAGTFFPLCSMNVAFDRELIGPAMMQGLMGDGQPWARYDDMFSGWAAKSVADHLGIGIKSGMPYIRHNKASNPFVNLRKEFLGLWWQELVLRFFMTEVRFSPSADTPSKAYKELAIQIRTRLKGIHNYFDRLATAMEMWTNFWDLASKGEIVFSPSRRFESGLEPINRNYFSFQAYKAVSGGNLNLVPEIEIHPVSSFSEEMKGPSPGPTSTERKHSELFEELYPKKTIVTFKDIGVGHQWKTYLVPLDKKFHVGPFKDFLNYTKDNQNHLTNVVPVDKSGDITFQEADYRAEVVILQKLLASLNFVDDINDADLVLVPALPMVKTARLKGKSAGGCRNHGRCADQWFAELEIELRKLNPKLPKKYLYLATQDESQNHKFYIERQSDRNSIIVTLGPNGLVVPSLNPIQELQPKYFKGCIPIEQRPTFLIFNQGQREWLNDRRIIHNELSAYDGEKAVSTQSYAESQMLGPKNATFVLCAPGDLPFQKRFFDTILMCSVPVVVARETKGGQKTYWSNVRYPPLPNLNSPAVEETYPKIGFPYSDILVEVNGTIIEEGKMMKYLESIPMEVIQRKVERIEEIRNKFVYDLDGTTEDAFSSMLDELHKMIKITGTDKDL